MAQSNCSCRFKEQIITEMKNMRKENPAKETQWVDLLFPELQASASNDLCCLLTYMFYYGYCKECTDSLSEVARSMLSPMMQDYEPKQLRKKR